MGRKVQTQAAVSAPERNPIATDVFRDALVEQMPVLRRYARSLCRNAELVDDLVQETMLKALENHHSFTPGTNMAGWLVVILRNTFFSYCKRLKREIRVSDGEYVQAADGPAEHRVELEAVLAAIAAMPDDHGELLVDLALGSTYAQAAKKYREHEGTIKSRTNRLRTDLRTEFEREPPRRTSTKPSLPQETEHADHPQRPYLPGRARHHSRGRAARRRQLH